MANWGSFDISEFKKFGANIEAMRKAWPRFMTECVHELANRLLAKAVKETIERTNYITGDLRRGWTVGQIVLNSHGAEIEVFNPVAYSSYVEYGHRTSNHQGWVEGRFMMTISVQELERELPAIMERKMERFIARFIGG
ncbi:hypothetical protein D3C74_182910 [compost metagenome]